MINCKDCKYFERIWFFDDETRSCTDPALSGWCEPLYFAVKIENPKFNFWNKFVENKCAVDENFGCVLGRQRKGKEKMRRGKKSLQLLEEKRGLLENTLSEEKNYPHEYPLDLRRIESVLLKKEERIVLKSGQKK